MYEVFLDLHKAYSALERKMYLDILEAYGVGPQAIHLFQIYWDCLNVVSQARGYYGVPFNGFLGVN